MAGPVLLVHDDIATIAPVRRLLAREGHEIVLATSVADAVIAFGHYLPALIVLAPSVEGHRGHLVLEELSQLPDARLMRVLLLGESIPGFGAPVVPLPLDGQMFLQMVSELMRGEGDVDQWKVREHKTSVARPSAPAAQPSNEPWRATQPAPLELPAGSEPDDGSPGTFADTEESEAPTPPTERPQRPVAAPVLTLRAQEAEAAAQRAMEQAHREVEEEAMASLDEVLGGDGGPSELPPQEPADEELRRLEDEVRAEAARRRQQREQVLAARDETVRLLSKPDASVVVPEEPWLGEPAGVVREESITDETSFEGLNADAPRSGASTALEPGEGALADDEARRVAEEEARRIAEEEARWAAAEETSQQAAVQEEESRWTADEESHRVAEEAAQQAAVEEESRWAAEEESHRVAEETAQQAAVEEESRWAAEEEARRVAEEAAQQTAAEEEARWAAEEEARRVAEEAAQQAAAEEEARWAAEEEAHRVAEEAAQREAAEEARRIEQEEEAQRAAERERWQAEAEALREREESLAAQLEQERRQHGELQRAEEERLRAEAQALLQQEREEQERLRLELEQARAEAERARKLERERALEEAQAVVEREREERARLARELEEAEQARAEAQARALEAERAQAEHQSALTDELEEVRHAAEQAQHTAEAAARLAEQERLTREAEGQARRLAEAQAAQAREEAQRLAMQVERAMLPLEVPGRASLSIPLVGQVSAETLATRVVDLAVSRVSVKLELKAEDVLRTLWFRRGALVGAVSSLPHESVLDRARRDGLIDGRQENELRALRGMAPLELVRVLVHRGYLREHEAVPLLQRYTEAVALEAFAEPLTVYRLVEEDAPPEVASAASPRPLLQVLVEALRRALAVLLDSPIDNRGLGLSERERKLLLSVDGERTVESLLMSSGLRQEQALKVLGVAQVLALLSTHASDGPAGEHIAPARELDVDRLEAKYREVQEADYFTILGLARNAGADEIERALERLTTEFSPLKYAGHPDGALMRRAEQVCQHVVEAAKALQDDHLRVLYARHLTE